MNLPIRSSAVFSPCRRYRYTLERIWGESESPRLVNFALLNPSTATAEINDATVERQQRRATAWGYDGLIVTNLFAWRSTDPDALLKVEEPIGVDNDRHILEQAKRAALVICGWGSHKSVHGRAPHVLGLLSAAGIKPYALKVSEKTGQPWHPLYVGYSAVPSPYEARA